MKQFVVYEVWTRSKIVNVPDGSTMHDVLSANDPKPIPGLGLCNWYAVEVPAVGPRKPNRAKGAKK